MSVRPRGKSWEATFHYRGSRYRKSFSNEADALAWERLAREFVAKGHGDGSRAEEGLQGLSSDGIPRTLRELSDLTYSRYWRNAKAASTLQRNAELCLRYLGEHRPPHEVNEHLIDKMIFAWQGEGKADSTINRRLSALSKMLTFAFERGYIKRKPKIERLKEPEHRIRYLSADEEAEMIAYMHHIGYPDMADFIAVSIDTGMRKGETLRLQKRDLSETHVTLWETKSGKARTIPLTKRAKKILHRRTEHLGPTDRLFDGWTPDRTTYYWDMGRRHLRLGHDPQFVPHAMRHTFCSRLVQKGVDIVTVSKLAGHSSITMTMRYAHLSPDNLAKAIKVLESSA